MVPVCTIKISPAGVYLTKHSPAGVYLTKHSPVGVYGVVCMWRRPSFVVGGFVVVEDAVVEDAAGFDDVFRRGVQGVDAWISKLFMIKLIIIPNHHND